MSWRLVFIHNHNYKDLNVSLRTSPLAILIYSRPLFQPALFQPIAFSSFAFKAQGKDFDERRLSAADVMSPFVRYLFLIEKTLGSISRCSEIYIWLLNLLYPKTCTYVLTSKRSHSLFKDLLLGKKKKPKKLITLWRHESCYIMNVNFTSWDNGNDQRNVTVKTDLVRLQLWQSLPSKQKITNSRKKQWLFFSLRSSDSAGAYPPLSKAPDEA